MGGRGCCRRICVRTIVWPSLASEAALAEEENRPPSLRAGGGTNSTLHSPMAWRDLRRADVAKERERGCRASDQTFHHSPRRQTHSNARHPPPPATRRPPAEPYQAPVARPPALNGASPIADRPIPSCALRRHAQIDAGRSQARVPWPRDVRRLRQIFRVPVGPLPIHSSLVDLL